MDEIALQELVNTRRMSNGIEQSTNEAFPDRYIYEQYNNEHDYYNDVQGEYKMSSDRLTIVKVNCSVYLDWYM